MEKKNKKKKTDKTTAFCSYIIITFDIMAYNVRILHKRIIYWITYKIQHVGSIKINV